MKYDIIRNNSLGNLVFEVNEAIKEGWEPQGGLSIDRLDDTAIFYCQAIINREE